MADIKEEIPPVADETKEEIKEDEKIESVTFESKEEYDKDIQRNKQLARNEFMKDLDITSKDDFKTQQEEYKKWKSEQMSETEKTNAEIETYKGKETEWTSKEFNYKADIAGLKLGIEDKYLKKVKILAKAEIKEDETLSIDDAFKKVLIDMPQFTKQNENDKKVDIKFGLDKKDTSKNEVIDKTKSDFMTAFGVKKK